MRRAVLLLLLALLAGCPAGVERESLAAGEDSADGQGGPGGAAPSECAVASDCVPAGPRCCDCPTHAVPASDPAQLACTDVACTPTTCGSPMQADCVAGQCVLECAPVACAGDVACSDGFAVDANGCLTCECAGVSDVGGECSEDSQCTRVREDCCGCDAGGMDTAVATTQVAAHEAALMCPANPSCPGGDVCAPDLAARCIQGTCSLVAGGLPAGACGAAGLPACPAGQTCTVNANDQATMHGVGICQP